MYTPELLVESKSEISYSGKFYAEANKSGFVCSTLRLAVISGVLHHCHDYIRKPSKTFGYVCGQLYFCQVYVCELAGGRLLITYVYSVNVMGFLSKGRTPLSWEETKKHADYVRKVGIQQLVAIYHQTKDRANDPLKFGDEVRS